jgi:two-component system LytT family response regulator
MTAEKSETELIRVLLVDDEITVRAALRETLNQHFPHIQVAGEAANIPEAVRQIRVLQPHLLFLDIEMPGYSGLQLLDFFNPNEVSFDIVFVTAFNQYAIRAFKIAAFDYLLKPVSRDDLAETLQRYSGKQQRQKTAERIDLLKQTYMRAEAPTQIAVSSLQGIDFIHLENIVLLEASGTYTNIVLMDGKTLVASKPLGEFEQVLQANTSFFRAHRSYLINLKRVQKLTSKEGDFIIMQHNHAVPLSRYRKKEFDNAIGGVRV